MAPDAKKKRAKGRPRKRKKKQEFEALPLEKQHETHLLQMSHLLKEVNGILERMETDKKYRRQPQVKKKMAKDTKEVFEFYGYSLARHPKYRHYKGLESKLNSQHPRWTLLEYHRVLEAVNTLPGFTKSKKSADARKNKHLVPGEDLHKLFKFTEYHPCGLMLRLVYGAGIRLIEVVNLRVQDVDFDESTILIPGRNKWPARLVYVPEILLEDLRSASEGKSQDDYLFSLREDRRGKGQPVTRRTLEIFLEGAVKKLRLRKITTEILRDNFGIHLLSSGVPQERLQEIMGFKNFGPVERITKMVPAGNS